MTPTETFDPVAFRAEQRQQWDSVAAGWARWHEVLEGPEAGAVQTAALLELAAVGPGDTVLDVATGCGEPGLSAARAVRPDGRVVCTDLSGSMLAIARERAEAAGLDNVEFVEADAAELSFAPGSFDAVLSRHGLQFVADPAGALTRYHSFLRRDGRLTAMVWGPPPTVGFARALPVILAELELPPPPTDGPGIFALADADRLARLVAEAGFHDVETGPLPVVYETERPEDFTRLVRDISAPITALVEGQPPEVADRIWRRVTEAWEPFSTPGGTTRIECGAVWVAGTR